MGGLGPGIGGLEILVIGLLALIVVGPKDLPLMMRKVGQFLARARAMASEFRSSFDEMARQAELDELRKEVEALRNASLEEVFREHIFVKNGSDGAGFDTQLTVNACFRIDVQHFGTLEIIVILGGVNAIDRADVYAGGVLGPNAWLSNDMRHRRISELW